MWVQLAVQEPWPQGVLAESWGSLLARRGDGGALLEVSWVGTEVPGSALSYKQELGVQKFMPHLERRLSWIFQSLSYHDLFICGKRRDRTQLPKGARAQPPAAVSCEIWACCSSCAGQLPQISLQGRVPVPAELLSQPSLMPEQCQGWRGHSG